MRGVQLIDISLRGLHVKRTSPLARPFVALLQRVLRETQLGQAFFGSIAKPQTVRNILREAYGRKEAVTEELVDKILSPGLLPGAVDVFLDFICYSGGPLPEELLEKTTVPVSMLWGEKVRAYQGSVWCHFLSVRSYSHLPDPSPRSFPRTLGRTPRRARRCSRAIHACTSSSLCLVSYSCRGMKLQTHTLAGLCPAAGSV